jgi:hypothetical protein
MVDVEIDTTCAKVDFQSTLGETSLGTFGPALGAVRKLARQALGGHPIEGPHE